MNDSDPNDVTLDPYGNPIPPEGRIPPEHPPRIGRYRVEKVLGKGGFGLVYLVHDEQLDRRVAMKVPHARLIAKPEDAEAYLTEARMVANLDHPGIVPVHDVGSDHDCVCYVVSKYVDGVDLSTKLAQGGLSYRESVEIVARVAEALHYAHKQGLVHRDVKPGNILIDPDNNPFVVDFGLALREENVGKGPGYAGTPAYMSPEQARGEGHRVDGRSDIFSLGVVFYEMLVGRRPFRGDTTADLLEQVTSFEARPIRQYNEKLPEELERIVRKAMAKRASERYSSAHDMAEDLRSFLRDDAVVGSKASSVPVASVNTEIRSANVPALPVGSTGTPSASAEVRSSDLQLIRIVPKGLRSFDAHDADFFLELLPGPRDQAGLPDGLRFWKTRIEEMNPSDTFSVGLIYGPSGCGKSSLVKAGLLPRLSESIFVVYVESTGEETETRLLHGLRRCCRDLPNEMSLKDTIAAVRRGHHIPVGGKVLIVLDQFEQWLHAHKEHPNAELVHALRQCDGGRVQCIVMVRDDFWLAVSRFMRELEVRLVEGQNISLVDLFDRDHAHKVLVAFGRAFGKLPDSPRELSREQTDFLRESVAGLSEEGRIICVRLALYAEMMKGRAWTRSTFREVGGTEGVGVTFLEETFSSSMASPDHRYHQQAARRVLKALLPDSGTDIKGQMKSSGDLLNASGYAERPRDFDDLIRILDSEIRLITPTDPEGVQYSGVEKAGLGQPAPSRQFYQLTHDYLVPSLREWLTRKQEETRRGRAELKLAERSALWNSSPENRYLLSLTEWLSIRTLTESRRWTAPQRALMNRAAKYHGARSGVTLLLLLMLVFTGLWINQAVNDRQEKLVAQKQEEQNLAEATRLVEGLLAANTAQVSSTIASLKEFRTWADPQLQQAFNDSALDSDAKLHAGLALVTDGQVVDSAVLDFLQQRLLTVAPSQFAPLVDLLKPHKSTLIPTLWKLAADDQQPAPQRFRAACSLAAFDPSSPLWNEPTFVALLAEQLVAINPEYIGNFRELLRPISPQLVPALSNIFRDAGRGELAKTLATSLLTDYARGDVDTLTELVIAADPASDRLLFPVLQQHREAAVKNLEEVLDQQLNPGWNDVPADSGWTEPSLAVQAQLDAAHGLINDRLAFCQQMAVSEFIEVAETLRASGYRPTRVRFVGGPCNRGTVVAAIWTRDSKRWHLDRSLSKAELPAPDAPASKDGLLLADIAMIPPNDESVEPQFIALWSEPISVNEQRRVLTDATAEEIMGGRASLAKEGFISQCTINVCADSSGQLCYTAIWSNQGAPSELRLAYAGFERVELPQWDVAVASETPLADRRELSARYAAVWRADVEFESRLLSKIPVEGVVERMRPLLAAGYRPFSIAVESYDSDGESDGGAGEQGSSLCSVVLHRPLIPDAAKESLALKQAAAATALLRLNSSEKVWPLLQDQPDPRLQSYIQHRLAIHGVDFQTIYTQIHDESDTSRLRALILGIGELARAKLVSREQQQEAIEDLSKHYANHPDPGIHGAAEWSLRHLGADNKIAEVQAAYSTGTAVGDRQWYLTTRGSQSSAISGMTLAVIQAEEEFLMGSPISEVDRTQGPTGKNEIRHRRLIGRRFAIGMHEVTVAQFRAFRSEHQFDRTKSRDEDSPANMISWYDAAAFCNWLSKEEGMPPEQWCYDPNHEFSEGMPLVPDYLQRTGYRLPTEAEWEFACRAGTTTARCFGETDTLLGEYGWYTKTSGDSWMSPVGKLRPNAAGLFDMHGNVLEWCQDELSLYQTDVPEMNDREQTGTLKDSERRMLRGGSFIDRAADVRTAIRNDLQPFVGYYGTGFRVARTYP